MLKIFDFQICSSKNYNNSSINYMYVIRKKCLQKIEHLKCNKKTI